MTNQNPATTSLVNKPIEFALMAERAYGDPFNEVEVDVVFADTAGAMWRVPAFWSGDNVFRVRFAAPRSGVYTWRSACTNPDDPGLHGQTGALTALPYTGSAELYRHGRLRVAQSRRTLEHADGTPFLWLADTWWMGLTQRLDWPDGFRRLTEDRVRKGFSAIQIVAGPLPDFCATIATWDPQQTNEAGWPWEQGFARINPAFYDLADLRLAFLVEQGLVPCIVGMWGYYLPFMGVERCRQHWRYLVARYGAYPVTWCLAGEATMPTYARHGTPELDRDREIQKAGWTEVARYVRELDPWHNPVTVHPSWMVPARASLADASLVDFDMLQTGHSGYTSLVPSVEAMQEAVSQEPRIPVLNSEVCYEGIMGASGAQIQRFMFYTCMLSGACGHTYGANGIWQFNREGDPYGDSPSGWSWGGDPWNVCMRYPGSAQMGLGRGLFERYEWWRMRPCPDRVKPRWSEDNYRAAYAAEIPGQALICYVPHGWPVTVNGLGEQPYTAYYFDPVTGEQVDIAQVAPAVDGVWEAPKPPSRQDWVLVVAEARSKAAT